MISPRAVAAASALGAVALIAYDPTQDHGLTCPFLAATGLFCPGCGSTRAVATLLRGDALGAFGYHPLVVPLLALATFVWVAWRARRRGSTARWAASPTTWPAWVPFAVAATFVTFAVARNVSDAAWLVPNGVS